MSASNDCVWWNNEKKLEPKCRAIVPLLAIFKLSQNPLRPSNESCYDWAQLLRFGLLQIRIWWFEFRIKIELDSMSISTGVRSWIHAAASPFLSHFFISNATAAGGPMGTWISGRLGRLWRSEVCRASQRRPRKQDGWSAAGYRQNFNRAPPGLSISAETCV